MTYDDKHITHEVNNNYYDKEIQCHSSNITYTNYDIFYTPLME